MYSKLKAKHGVCATHLLRDLADVAIGVTQTAWAAGLASLLVEINAACDEARRRGLMQLAPAHQRGPAVHGKRGDRFIHLTWGNVCPDSAFEMFRRAKLTLDRVEPHLIDAAIEAGCLRAEVNLTGGDGGPRCARVDPPAVAWSVPVA